MAGELLVDGRNFADRDAVRVAGLVYEGIGRSGGRSGADAGTDPRRRGGHAAAPAHLPRAQAGDRAGGPSVHVVHARVAARARRRPRDPLLRFPARRGPRRARRRIRVGGGAHLRRGAEPAGYRQARSSTPRICSTSASSCSTATCSPTSTSPRSSPSTRRPARGRRSRSIRSTTRRRMGSCAAARTTRSGEFVEKPNAEEIDTHLINAGAYILERNVLDEMAPGRHAHLDRARPVPAARRPRALRLRGVGLLDGHRDPAALPAGDLGHPRRPRSAPTVGTAISQAGGVLCPEGLPGGHDPRAGA